jgi:hypothetical protein
VFDVRRCATTRRLSAALAIATGSIVCAQTSAYAAATHQYARGWESTEGAGHYTGGGMTRYDGEYTVPAGSNCTTPYGSGANAAYQPLWVQSTDAQTWVEIGTGHNCNGYRFWYAGYGTGGAWTSIYTHAFVTTASHTFDVDRVSGVYKYYISAAVVATYAANWGGDSVVTGLETYETNTIAPEVHNSSLRYQVDGVLTDHQWSGMDGHDTPAGIMCGHFDSNTQWRYSENEGGPPAC